jgi:hypothetical protein
VIIGRQKQQGHCHAVLGGIRCISCFETGLAGGNCFASLKPCVCRRSQSVHTRGLRVRAPDRINWTLPQLWRKHQFTLYEQPQRRQRQQNCTKTGRFKNAVPGSAIAAWDVSDGISWDIDGQGSRNQLPQWAVLGSPGRAPTPHYPRGWRGRDGQEQEGRAGVLQRNEH